MDSKHCGTLPITDPKVDVSTILLHSPTYTLFFPLRVEPHTDGRSWARRRGLDRHYGLRPGEELTDEDDD